MEEELGLGGGGGGGAVGTARMGRLDDCTCHLFSFLIGGDKREVATQQRKARVDDDDEVADNIK